MGITSGLISAGGALAGMFGGGGANNVQLPPMFNMPNMGAAAGNVYSDIQNLGGYSNVGTAALPYAENTFQGLYNNPYAGGYQAGANIAGGLGTSAALGAYGTGGAIQGAGLSQFPWMNALEMSGFDPQSALYNRTVQQLQDQTRAGLEARGVDNSPYGAGVEGQTMANFNIDWQNNQLQRQLAAAQGAGSLGTQGANIANIGTGIQSAAPGQFATSAGLPYATYAGIGGGQNTAIQNWQQLAGMGQNLGQGPIADWFNYINAGTGAENAATNVARTGLMQQQQGFNQNQLYGSNLGGALYGLGRSYGGGPGSFTGSPFANWGYNQMTG